jgi:hypothetical protein
MKVYGFDDALKRANKQPYLLLGNGFSISCRSDIFHYASLYKRANFSKVPSAAGLFKAAGTQDFETVIRNLSFAAKIIREYLPEPKKIVGEMLWDASELKDILVHAIASNHPDIPHAITDDEYRSCRQFLANFGHLYSLNYDLLLYWALMHNDVDKLKIAKNDGFTESEIEEDAEYVAWGDYQRATIYYLHGALHLFDSGAELQKYTWVRTSIPLIDQIRSALEKDFFPLFVAEGTSSAKLDKISHSAYLHKAYRSFSSIAAPLFIFGHSLADNDDHILRKIGTGRVTLFVSIYGDPSTDANRAIISKAQNLGAARKTNKLDVCFYDAASARVWR